jgi:RHS repeat-associated protein
MAQLTPVAGAICVICFFHLWHLWIHLAASPDRGALARPDSTVGFRTYYVYDGNDVALTLVRPSTGTTWRIQQRYVNTGLDENVAARLWLNGTPTSLALVTDRQGGYIMGVKANGLEETSTGFYLRNAFGKMESGSTAASSMETHTGLGFAGAGTPTAAGGGYVYLRNRWYDPQTGRFLSQDPIGLAGGVNLYAYAGNNPASYSDPFGLCPPNDSNWGPQCPRPVLSDFLGAIDKKFGTHWDKRFFSTSFARGSYLAANGIGPALLAAEGAGTVIGTRTRVGTRYVGAAEAAIVEETQTIPATNAAKRPRVIHYTTDAPTMSASGAQAKYQLPATPTPMCQFPLCSVRNDVAPVGEVAANATQRATSQPINGAGRPLPLEP